jgi:hypothetical protein
LIAREGRHLCLKVVRNDQTFSHMRSDPPSVEMLWGFREDEFAFVSQIYRIFERVVAVPRTTRKCYVRVANKYENTSSKRRNRDT